MDRERHGTLDPPHKMAALINPYTFVTTSAINTRFGIYPPRQRLEQTLVTVASVRRRVPNANVVLLEIAGRSPAEEQARALKSADNVYMDFNQDDDVKQIFDHRPGKDSGGRPCWDNG